MLRAAWRAGVLMVAVALVGALVAPASVGLAVAPGPDGTDATGGPHGDSGPAVGRLKPAAV